jgi:hypothetical protein
MDLSAESQALDKDAAELLCKKLGQAVVGCVRTAASLPIGRDYEYYKSFPQFRDTVASSKTGRSVDRRLIATVDKLITQLTPNGPRSSMATAAVLDAEVLSVKLCGSSSRPCVGRLDESFADLAARYPPCIFTHVASNASAGYISSLFVEFLKIFFQRMLTCC